MLFVKNAQDIGCLSIEVKKYCKPITLGTDASFSSLRLSFFSSHMHNWIQKKDAAVMPVKNTSQVS
jgi:hypothetical protein